MMAAGDFPMAEINEGFRWRTSPFVREPSEETGVGETVTGEGEVCRRDGLDGMET